MNTATLDYPVEVPSIFDRFPKVATQPRHAVRPRNLAFLSSLLAVPVATGVGIGLASSSVRRGLLAGGVAALALGALRWQLSRWFAPSPAYSVEATIGEIELRRYPVRIEARAEVQAHDFEGALARGFGHLACYIYGANAKDQDIEMTTPVLTTMRDGRYEMSFVMPPALSMSELPHPDDPRIELREVEEKRVAALRFRGRFTKENIEGHERELLRQLLDAGLSAKGSVMFAGYDSPATIPLLRRNELWIEIV